jgi:hypothetical protein
MYLFEKYCYLDAIECYKLSLEFNSQDEKVKDHLTTAQHAIYANEDKHLTRTHELLPSAPNKRNWRTELTDDEKKIATNRYSNWLQAHQYSLK